jgi:hypothetical protein
VGGAMRQRYEYRTDPDGRGRAFPVSHLKLVGQTNDGLVQEILWLHQPVECDNARCNAENPGWHCASDCDDADGSSFGVYPCPTVRAIASAYGADR